MGCWAFPMPIAQCHADDDGRDDDGHDDDGHDDDGHDTDDIAVQHYEDQASCHNGSFGKTHYDHHDDDDDQNHEDKTLKSFK